MALPMKLFGTRNSLISHQASVNVTNCFVLRSKLNYSSIAADSASSTSQPETQTAKSIHEMPGMNTTDMMKEFIMGKIVKNPKTIPVFDRRQTFKFWTGLRDAYGQIFKISLFGRKFVAITNPDHIEELYRITMTEPVRGGLDAMKKIRHDAVNNFFDKKAGILTENFDEWRRVRSRVQTPMMRPKNIIRYLKEMDNVSKDFTDRIAELQQKYGEMPKDFQQEIYKWALESVGTVALNRRMGCLKSNLPSDSGQVKLIDSVNTMFEMLSITQVEFPWWKFIYSPSFNKLKKEHEFLAGVIHSHVTEAANELERKEVEGELPEELTLLENFLLTEGLTRKDVVVFMLDMFFAGIDTTSHTLAFTLYLLARNKEKQKKLQVEIDSVIGDGKGTLTEEQLAKLSYLKACIKESLRLFPLAPGTIRLLQEDAILGGFKIPKGYLVFPLNLVTSRDERYFKHSKEFIPERWMRDRPLGHIHPYAALPFSHGTRMCIGRRIAEQEMYTFLTRVMHRFTVDYKYEDMGIISRLVAVPSEPLRFEFTERKI